MAKKSIGEKKQDKERQENLALQRILTVILCGLAAEIYLITVNKFYFYGTVSSMLAWNVVLRYGTYLGLVLLVAGIGVAVWKREDRRLRRPMLWMAGVGAFLAVSGYVLRKVFEGGATIMCTAVAVVAILAVLYFLYQHECMLTVVSLSGALFAAWVCAHAVSSRWRIPVLLGTIASVAALAVLAYLTRKAQGSDGMLFGQRVISPGADYRVMYAAYALSAVAVILAWAVPAIAVGLEWALAVLLFAALAYYTTKLM